MRVFQWPTGKIIAQLSSNFLLNIATNFAETISAKRGFHINAAHAARQCLRRFDLNRDT